MEPPPIPPYLTDPPKEPIYKSFYFSRPSHRTMSLQSQTKQKVVIMYEPRRFSCAIVESTSITSSTVPQLPKRVKQPASGLRTRIRRFKQFFESINPKNDFKSNEDLEEYLYNKSLEIQPKGVDTPTCEVKPKHTASTLRSPGVKPPKTGNHYTANHPIGLHLHTQHSHSAPHAMSSQSNTVPSTPITAHETKRSLSQNQEDSQFSMMDVRFDRKGNLQKIPVLQPPPLLPRSRHNPNINSASLPPTTQAPMPPAPKSSGMMSTAPSPTSTSTTPSSALGPAPKLHPRRVPPPMSPLAKSPLTPSKDKNSPSAFQFPVVYEVPPPLPPRPSTSSDASSSSPSTSSSAAKENQEQLRVLFDREESHSPTVRLSVPLPPALPPPRGSTVQRAPPPLPPKSNRHNSSSPTSSSDPFEDPTSPSIFVNTPPPPLPPKTYRTANRK